MVAATAAYVGLAGQVQLCGKGLAVYKGHQIGAEDLERTKAYIEQGHYNQSDFVNGAKIDFEWNLEDAIRISAKDLPDLMDVEVPFTIIEPDGRDERLCMMTVRVVREYKIMIELSADAAEQVRDWSERNLFSVDELKKIPKIQKRWMDEQRSVALHEGRSERYIDLYSEMHVVTNIWTLSNREDRWKMEQIDGTFLYMSRNIEHHVLIVYDQPIEPYEKQYDIDGSIRSVFYGNHETPDDCFMDSWSFDERENSALTHLCESVNSASDVNAATQRLRLVKPDNLINVRRIFDLAAFNIDRAEKVWKRRNGKGKPDRPSWLIEDLLPAGEVVLIAGDGGSGKSTLMHELAVAIATPAGSRAAPHTWLRRPVDRSRSGMVLFLSMEEPEARFGERAAKLDPLGEAEDVLFERCNDKADLERALKDYSNRTQKTGAPRLVIIDSASKFREGSELNDQDVNAFFEPLERFAHQTGATVVVIHHLNKEGRANKETRTAATFRARVSGHSAFINRPRLAIGMHRDGDGPDAIMRIGVIKENVGLGHLEGTFQPYRRDEETYRHIPIDEPERPAARRKPASNTSSSKPAAAVDKDWGAEALTAASKILKAGGRLTKTGTNGLYAQRVPELAGLSRNKLDAIVNGLIESGALVKGEDGLIYMPMLAATALAAE